MSLASRVARLVRATLHARFGGPRGARREPHDPPRDYTADAYARDDANRERHPGPTRSRQDPVLAGLYANLELPYGADREAVRAARRRLLARYHPDRYATDPDKARLSHDLVRQLNHAHDELLKRLER